MNKRFVESKTATKKQKLSKRFAGYLTTERTDELSTELNQMRKEGERNTYYMPTRLSISWDFVKSKSLNF